MADVKDGGSAFPFQLTVVDRNNPENIQKARAQGMTLREYAAIRLKVPNSGTDWLDDMIRDSLRNDMAGQALEGLCANSSFSSNDFEFASAVAYELADAMLKAREGGE